MIQIDAIEKASLGPPPPSYSPPAPERPELFNGQSIYPPQTQPQPQPTPTNFSPHNTGYYPAASPMVASPTGRPPLATDAAIGSQYQQQLFARCARGDHEVETKYGPCGIITAVICFPIGLIALFLDVEKKCSRCGARLS